MDQTNDENKYCVYRHVFPNGKVYVGQTCQSPPEKRWDYGGNKYKEKNKSGEYRQPYIARAIDKYGWKNVQHEILFENLTKCEANRMEQICIVLFRSNNGRFGYNLTEGGEGCIGKQLSDETKRKIGKANTGRFVGGNSPLARPVVCLELNKIFESTADAGKEVNVNHSKISYACSGKRNSAAGYHFLYADEFSVSSAKNVFIHKNSSKDIPVMCVETGIIYDNIALASKSVSIDPTCVRRCVYGIGNTAGGMHWKEAEKEWFAKREKLADEIISKLLENEELMNEINKFRSGK